MVHGLAVYLHQDEADDWYSNWAFDVIASWALSKDIMIVAPLAPSLYEDGTHGYGAAGTEDTVNAIGPLLTKFKKTYAPTKPTLFWGRSGGSWFMTTWLIPSYGDRLPGLYVPSCGGDVSIPSAWAWDPARVGWGGFVPVRRPRLETPRSFSSTMETRTSSRLTSRKPSRSMRARAFTLQVRSTTAQSIVCTTSTSPPSSSGHSTSERILGRASTSVPAGV